MPKTTSTPILPGISRGVIQPPRVQSEINTLLGKISATGGIRLVRDYNGGLKIINDNPAAFTGTVYCAGVKLSGLASDGTKPFVKVDVSTNTGTEETGPIPNPQPDNEVWFEKANTYGDFHIHRM